MERDPTLMADILAEKSAEEPSAAELVSYAVDAAGLEAAARARVERYLAASPAHRDRFRALAPPEWTLVGSCLCGSVCYAVRGPLPDIGHCHCRRCRKAHGAAFGSFALVEADAFVWKAGSEYLTRFGGDGDELVAFCRRCGTTLTGNAPPGRVALAVATLDVDPASRPVVHASVADGAAWFDEAGDVPRLAGPVPHADLIGG